MATVVGRSAPRFCSVLELPDEEPEPESPLLVEPLLLVGLPLLLGFPFIMTFCEFLVFPLLTEPLMQ